MFSSDSRPARRLRRTGLVASALALAASSLTIAPSPADAVGNPITISGFNEVRTSASWHLYDPAFQVFQDIINNSTDDNWLIEDGIQEPGAGFLRTDVFFTGAYINPADPADPDNSPSELAEQEVIRTYLESGRGVIATTEADRPADGADLDLTDAFDSDPTDLANVAWVAQQTGSGLNAVNADVKPVTGFTSGANRVKLAGFKGYFDTSKLPAGFVVLVESTFGGAFGSPQPVVVVYPAGIWNGDANAGPLVLAGDADIFGNVDYNTDGVSTSGTDNTVFITELMNWMADQLGAVTQEDLDPLSGYWMLDESGRVYNFGDAQEYGNAAVAAGNRAVDLEDTDDGLGYWVVDNKGNVFPKGSAQSFSTPPALQAGEEVTALSKTPSGNGYWLFTNLGRVFNYGDAAHFGDMSGTPLNGPVLDAIPTVSGLGYYMVGSDGGVFAFGDAKFHGSMGGLPLNKPVQSLVPDPDGVGYWLVASDGGVFAFKAVFRGSMGGTVLNQPVTGMVPWGTGYLMVATDGGIFSFGGPFKGSLGGTSIPSPIKSVAAFAVN